MDGFLDGAYDRCGEYGGTVVGAVDCADCTADCGVGGSCGAVWYVWPGPKARWDAYGEACGAATGGAGPAGMGGLWYGCATGYPYSGADGRR